MNKYKYIIGLVGFFFLLTGCSAEDFDNNEKNNSGTDYIEANIAPIKEGNTRALLDPIDNWTVSEFTKGDVVGLISTKGDNNSPYDGKILNGKMICDSKVTEDYKPASYLFRNPELMLEPNGLDEKTTVLYYPYSTDLDVYENFEPKKTEGLSLRKLDNGIEKCIDFIYTDYISTKGGQITASFRHMCMELMIIRGEGFRNASDKTVNVVLEKPYTGVYLKKGENDWTGWRPNLIIYNGGEENNLKYRKWEAWSVNPEDDYRIVLVPAIESDGVPTRVSYIEIRDDYGNLQKIGDFYLEGEGSKNSVEGGRYALEVELSELKPIVRPVAILEWEKDKEISNKQERGISSAEHLFEWASYYNLFIKDQNNQAAKEILLQYGDGNVDGSKISWTFYITGDIEITDFTKSYVVEEFRDKLVGASDYTNYYIGNLKKPLFDKMTASSSISKIDFNDLYIDGSTENKAIGGVVKELEGGEIINCRVNDCTIISGEAVGAFAGSVNEGSIKNCSASGNIYGTETNVTASKDNFGLFGSSSSSPQLEGNNTKYLFFGSTN